MTMSLPKHFEVRDHSFAYTLAYPNLATEAALELLAVLSFSGMRSIEVPARALDNSIDAERWGYILSELPQWSGLALSILVQDSDTARKALDAGIRNLECSVSAAGDEGRSARSVPSLEVLSMLAAQARSVHGTCEVRLTDAWDTRFGAVDTDRVLEAVDSVIEAGADRVRLEDTMGTATPGRVASLVSAVRTRYPALPVFVRMQNTRGMGMAGVLAAMQAGASGVDTAVGGVSPYSSPGGETRNVPTEEVVYMCREMDVETGVDLDGILAAGFWIQDALNCELDGELLWSGDYRNDRRRGSGAGPGHTTRHLTGRSRRRAS